MNRKPLVTIRIPAFNHEDFIEKAIMSAVNQTYENIELIVIDDGSTDKTPEIAQRLADKYGFIFIRQENVGVSETMNRLFALSNGEYILGCASDDFLDENAVENALKIALETDADIVCGRVKIVDNDGKVTGELNFNCSDSFRIEELILSKVTVPKQGFFFKSSILKNIYPIPPDVTLEDAYTILKIDKRTNFIKLDCIIKYYRFHGMNTISNPWGMYQKKKQLIKKYADIKENDLYILKTKYNWFNDLASYNRIEALKYYVYALKFIWQSKFSINGIKRFLFAHFKLLGFKKNKLR